MCDIGELERCSVWREEERRSRRERVCDACGGTIERGERYTSHFSVFEGDATSESMCAGCKPARVEFCAAHFEWALTCPSYFATTLFECVGEDGDDSRWEPMKAAMQDRQNARKAKAGAA